MMAPSKKRRKVELKFPQAQDTQPNALPKEPELRGTVREVESIGRTSKFTLADLPGDVLYETAACLTPLSLLCLSQTCTSIRSIFTPDTTNRLFYDALPAYLYLENARFVRKNLGNATQDATNEREITATILGAPYCPHIDYKKEIRYRVYYRKSCCICLDPKVPRLFKVNGQPFGTLKWCEPCYEQYEIYKKEIGPLLRQDERLKGVDVPLMSVVGWHGEKIRGSRHWRPTLDVLLRQHVGEDLETILFDKKVKAREWKLLKTNDSRVEKMRRHLRWKIISEAERLWKSNQTALQHGQERLGPFWNQVAPTASIKDCLFAPEALSDEPIDCLWGPYPDCQWPVDPTKQDLSWNKIMKSQVSDEWITSTAQSMLDTLRPRQFHGSWSSGFQLPSFVTPWYEVRRQWQLARMKSSLDSGAVINMDLGADLPPAMRPRWDRVMSIREVLGLPQKCHGEEGRVRKGDEKLEAFNKIITSTCDRDRWYSCWIRKPFDRGGYEALVDHIMLRHWDIFWTCEITFWG